MTNRPDPNDPQTGGQVPYQPQGQTQQPQQYQAPQQPYAQQVQYQAPQQPQQPYPGQYQPYPGGPNFSQKPRRPGWVIPLIVVAVVAVILCAVLFGVLLGRGSTYGPDTRSEPAASSALPSEAPASEPVPTEPPAETSSAKEPDPAPPAQNWSVGACLEEAIDQIEDQAQFVEDYTFEPLGCLDDFDGDGYQDFLASYETEARNGTRCVSYCVYTFREDGPRLVIDGVLYQAVGGNGGSVGISKGKDGSAYLTRFTKEADGSSVHNDYEYIPFWDLGVTEDNLYRMESQWDVITPEQGNYFLSGRKVDQETFNVSRGNYEEWYSLNILVGHGNGEVNGVDFETLEQWYGD